MSKLVSCAAEYSCGYGMGKKMQHQHRGVQRVLLLDWQELQN